MIMKKLIEIDIDTDSDFKDGELVYAPNKKQSAQKSIFIYDSKIDYSTYYNGRFYKVIDAQECIVYCKY